MTQTIMGMIQELSEERERILAREGRHRAEGGDRGRVGQIDHDRQVLWDLRRRELAGEAVSLREDYYDRYTVDPGDDPRGAAQSAARSAARGAARAA
jgi:hypothetical protein